jgi:hypothetical protein
VADLLTVKSAIAIGVGSSRVSLTCAAVEFPNILRLGRPPRDWCTRRDRRLAWTRWCALGWLIRLGGIHRSVCAWRSRWRDVKLLGALGAWLGPAGAIWVGTVYGNRRRCHGRWLWHLPLLSAACALQRVAAGDALANLGLLTPERSDIEHSEVRGSRTRLPMLRRLVAALCFQ